MVSRLQVGVVFVIIKNRCELYKRIAPPYIPHHQGILYGPGIVAINEPYQSLFAVAGKNRVFKVDGFAFYKEAILIAENG